MPDKKYDAVIVGGGHHATIIACYLARAGLKTAMFESGMRWAAARAAKNYRCRGLSRTLVPISRGFTPIRLMPIST